MAGREGGNLLRIFSPGQFIPVPEPVKEKKGNQYM
jgi:hypothetical protein